MPPGVPVRLGGRDILYITGITAHLPRKTVPHAISPQPFSSLPVTSDPDSDVVFSHALPASETGAPPMTCRIISRDNGRRVTISVESESRLPALTLMAILPHHVLPSRYKQPQKPFACQFAVGPAVRLAFDSLQDAETGRYVTFSGDVVFESAQTGYLIRTRSGAGMQTPLLRLELQPPVEEKPTVPLSAATTGALAPPVTTEQATRLVTQWAFTPPSELTAMPSPAEALSQLPLDRADLVARIHPRQPVLRVDRACDSSTFNLAISHLQRHWNLLCFNNTSGRGRTDSVSLKNLGIVPADRCRFAVYDFWQQQLVSVTDDSFEVDLPANDCRVLCISDVRPDEPCVIGAGDHITQGLPDLVEVAYHPGSMTLAGRSLLTPGRPYELRILLPIGQKSLEIAGIEAAVASHLVRADGPLRIVALESDTEQMISWSIRFRAAELPLEQPLPPDRMTSQQNTRGVELRWAAGESRPARYRIYRNAKVLATVPGFEYRYQDSDVVYNAEYIYTIRSVDWSGRESEPLPSGVHRTPIPADAYLSQLVPLPMDDGRRAPPANRSAGGKPLRMAGRRYSRGLGTTTETRIEYFLGKGYERFTGEVGIDDDTAVKGRARFEIRTDGRPVFRSGPLAVGQRPQRFDVDVRGCRILTLTVTDADGSNNGIHANWGDTYLRASFNPGR